MFQCTTHTSRGYKRKSFRKNKFSTITIVNNFPKIEESGTYLECPRQLLALIVMPRSLVPLLCKEADHIPPHVACIREDLDIDIVSVGHNLGPSMNELLKSLIAHSQNVSTIIHVPAYTPPNIFVL